MTELMGTASEALETSLEATEERRHVIRRVTERVGSLAVENARDLKDAFSEKDTKRVVGSLAVLGAVSTATQFGHLMDHSGTVLEFYNGSGRHLLVGYLGAVTGVVTSKAETMRGKIAAAAVGALGSDAITEFMQSLIVTGGIRGGNWHDIMSFVSHKELVWGNIKDAAASELAAGGAVVQSALEKRAA